MKTVWILTEEYNDYNQHGEYLVEVFETKPTKDVLAKTVCWEPTSIAIDHLFHGGGRMKWEDSWYNLRETPLQKGGSVNTV